MSVSELSEAEEEQRTENPCVPGSIPGGTTLKDKILISQWKSGSLLFYTHVSIFTRIIKIIIMTLLSNKSWLIGL